MRLVPLDWGSLKTACEYRRLQRLELTIHVVSLFHEKAQYEHFAQPHTITPLLGVLLRPNDFANNSTAFKLT